MNTSIPHPATPGSTAPRIVTYLHSAMLERIITVVIVVLAVVMCIARMPLQPLFFAFVPFTIVHGLRRYGAGLLSAYTLITLAISLALENLSIATGFPFGNYYYTAGAPRIGEVPLTVGIIYCALGYVCWIAANALLDGADQRLRDRTNPGRWVELVALPACAALLMTMFDLGSDSVASTIGHTWIWEQGGGVFGVPWTNYAGWWLVTYLFYQAFVLVLAFVPRGNRRPESAGREPLTHGVVLYLLLGLMSVSSFVLGSPGTVQDATGQIWNTVALTETMMCINLFGSVAIALVALTKLARNDLARWSTPSQLPTSE